MSKRGLRELFEGFVFWKRDRHVFGELDLVGIRGTFSSYNERLGILQT